MTSPTTRAGTLSDEVLTALALIRSAIITPADLGLFCDLTPENAGTLVRDPSVQRAVERHLGRITLNGNLAEMTASIAAARHARNLAEMGKDPTLNAAALAAVARVSAEIAGLSQRRGAELKAKESQPDEDEGPLGFFGRSRETGHPCIAFLHGARAKAARERLRAGVAPGEVLGDPDFVDEREWAALQAAKSQEVSHE